MSAYSDILDSRGFQPNCVIQIRGQYFCARQPDSGLSIGAAYRGTIPEGAMPSIEPAEVDLQASNTPIENHSFSILDRDGILTALFSGNPAMLTGEEVFIWMGFTTGAFDFSDYLELGPYFVKTIAFDEGSRTYVFTVANIADRMSTSAFSVSGTLPDSISDATTTIFAPAEIDLTTIPASGMFRLDDEFIGYTGVDTVDREFTGCLRALKGSTAVAHDAGADLELVQDLTDNPLTILLQILVSVGGGGTYDALWSGCGLDQTLVDVAGIEAIRDSVFLGVQFNLTLYGIDNVLNYLETEILAPCNLRFVPNEDGLLSICVLDRSPLNIDRVTITKSSIALGSGKWNADDQNVMNQIQFQWDYDEVSGKFNQSQTFKNAASIAQYGLRAPFPIASQGIKASLGGSVFVANYVTRFFRRFAFPMPQLEIQGLMDTSLIPPGSKVLVTTDKFPTKNGDYNFSSELEVLSRGVRHADGSVPIKLAYTSYSDVKQGFIAPSDLIVTVNSQSSITLAAGRGKHYRAGWKLRMKDMTTGLFLSDGMRTIDEVIGDTITFTTTWSTTLVAGQHRVKFPTFSNAVGSQRQFAFVGNTGGAPFSDGSAAYQITF